MRKVTLFILKVSALAAVAVSCSHKIHEEPKPFLISADKGIIVADGKDIVTFSVLHGEKDLSESEHTFLVLSLNGDESSLRAGQNWFGTGIVGEYDIKAYNDSLGIFTSNSVKLTVKEVETIAREYKKRRLGFQFLFSGSEDSRAFSELTTSFHQSCSQMYVPVSVFPSAEDPLFCPAAAQLAEIFGIKDEYPSLRLDYSNEAKEATSGSYNEIRQDYLKNRASLTGISLRSSYDKLKGQISVIVSVRSGCSKPAGLLIMLVENKLTVPAAGQGNWNYVLRQMVSSPHGDALNSGNPLKANTTYSMICSVQQDPSWNTDNMALAVSVLITEDDGWTLSSNAVIMPLGSSLDYEIL